MAGVSGLLALSVRYISLSRPPMAAPAPAAEPEGTKPSPAEEPRERLPYWLVPVASWLLLVGAMIGWLQIESGAWLAQPAGLPPGGVGMPGMSGYSTPYTVNGTTMIMSDGSIERRPTDTVAPVDPAEIPATK